MIPINLGAAIDQLEADLSPEDRAYLQSVTCEEFLGGAHFFSGMALRNEWHLWEKEGPLNEDLARHGFYHGDDRSGLLLAMLWRRVNGLPWSEQFIANLAEEYRQHWASQGVKPDGTPL